MTTRNITTLSLITATIIGLNGCGGDSSSPKASTQPVSSITALANASQKHSDTDWKVLTGQINALDKAEKFNTMLSTTTEKNVAVLTSVGIDKEEAYAINSDMMYDDLVELDIEILDEEVTTECQENEICKEEAYASLQVDLTIDKEEAYAMAEEVRDNDKEEAYAIVVNDGLVKEFSCASDEVKTVRHYGFEDVFSTANGVEPTSQYPSDIDQNMIDYNNNVNAGFANYDETPNNRQFLDDINNLPAGVTSGRFYIGLKSNGSSLQGNDTISLGDFSGTNDRYAKALAGLQGDGWSKQLVNNNTPTTAIYSNALSAISLNQQAGNPTGDTLLTLVQNNQRFGAYVQDDTSVDFITVATCSKPDPIQEVTAIVNKFECSEKETLIKILGGAIDNFAAAGDPVTPRPDLITKRDANTAYPGVIVPYDYTQYDHHFIDTLDIATAINGGTITKAQFNMGYKVIGSSLASNDALYLGDIEINHAGGHLYDATTPLSAQGWSQPEVSGYGYVAQRNINSSLANTRGTGNVFDTMVNNGYLDVYVQDDTAVDFTQLNLCVKKSECDENAKEHNIDLSKLASWTEKPSDAEENSVGNPNVWAADMNWIKFNNDGKERILKIPFCACGDTLVNIEHLKGDNIAEVTLDATSVAYQPWSTNNVAGFIADSAGGNHVDGSKAITGTGVGVNHVLELNATNLYSSTGNSTPFGVAVDGTLSFKGNLGRCK